MKKAILKKSVSHRGQPAGGDLAVLGFYTRPVQAVVRKWKDRVPPDLIQEYFRIIAFPVVLSRCSNVEIHFSTISPEHWRLVFELGNAITKVMEDDSKIEKWLLTLPIFVGDKHGIPSWDSIGEKIEKRMKLNKDHMPITNAVKQTAKRLRLLTRMSVSK